MALINDIILPDEIQQELTELFKRITASCFVEYAKLDTIFAKGMRPIHKNAETFRTRMLNLALSDAVVPKPVLLFIRKNSFYQQFTCICSTLALTEGYDSFAGFVGEAKLLLAMLLDKRPEIIDFAKQKLENKTSFVPPAENPEAARKAMANTFEWFIDTLETMLMPPPAEPAPTADDVQLAESLRNYKQEFHALQAENKKLNKQIQEYDKKSNKTASTHETHTRALTSRIQQLEAQLTATNQLKQVVKESEKQNKDLQRQLTVAQTAEHQKAEIEQALRAEIQAEREKVQRLQSALQAALKSEKDAPPATVARAESTLEFSEILDEDFPVQSGILSPRDRLSSYIGETIPSNQKLLFLIDGHNVINILPQYTVDRDGGIIHEELRKQLINHVRLIKSKLIPCEVRIFFDGGVAAERSHGGDSTIRIIYSGGNGEHRADKRIIQYADFVNNQPDAPTLITVTEDQDLLDETAHLGSFPLHPSDFSSL